MKIYGHPWSINTRKVLAALAEKGGEAELVFINVPVGEHLAQTHAARHPFLKIPVLGDGDLVVYETIAIMRYLDRTLDGPALMPSSAREGARADQWISVASSYFIPLVHPLLVETIFRRHLGGERSAATIEAGRSAMRRPLDVLDAYLASNEYLAGTQFSLADLYWMPYLEYLSHAGEGRAIADRRNLAAWWERVSSRPAWRQVARGGLQPYDADASPEAIARLHRR